MHQCRYCGRFLSLAKPHGWYAHGEYGEDTGFVCERCLPTWTPQDSRGRGPEAGYCGVRAEGVNHDRRHREMRRLQTLRP
jgi:hypothetical protein